MNIEIITPAAVLLKGEASSVVLPGKDGSFGVLDHHAAMISALEAGKVEVKGATNTEGDLAEKVLNGEVSFEVNGGVAEVRNNKLIVLAE